MKKSTLFLSLALACATAFTFASCGAREKKFQEVSAEAQEAVFTEYKTKYVAARSDALYVKDYMKINADAEAQGAKFDMSFTVDGDYGWKKADDAVSLDEMALAVDSRIVLNGAGIDHTQDSKTETYVKSGDGLYMKVTAGDEETKSFTPFSSSSFPVPDDFEPFEFLSGLFDGAYSEIAASENLKFYSYSDASGSGFRIGYSLSPDTLTDQDTEGLDDFLAIFRGEEATFNASVSISVFFDAFGKLDYAENKMTISVSGNVADSDASEVAVKGSFSYYQKTKAHSSSTVKFPSDLDSYKNKE